MRPTFYIAPSSIAYNLRDNCMRCNWFKANHFLRSLSRESRSVDFTPYNVVDAAFKKAQPIQWLRENGIPVSHIVPSVQLRGKVETDLAVYAFKGTPDMVVALMDGTFGLIELKCTAPTASAVEDYKPQVASYKHMDPRISRAWIVFFNFAGFVSLEEGILNGSWTVSEVELDGFDLGSACDKLGQFFVMPIPPLHFHCADCKDRKAAAELVLSYSDDGEAGGDFTYMPGPSEERDSS